MICKSLKKGSRSGHGEWNVRDIAVTAATADRPRKLRKGILEMGASINHVDCFLDIFDPSSPLCGLF